MDIKLFEQFLIDKVGLNKEVRTMILEYVQKPESKQSIKIEENIDLDKPIEGQRQGETLLEYAIRHKAEFDARENRKMVDSRKELNESFKDIDRLVRSAYEGIKSK